QDDHRERQEAPAATSHAAANTHPATRVTLRDRLFARRFVAARGVCYAAPLPQGGDAMEIEGRRFVRLAIHVKLAAKPIVAVPRRASTPSVLTRTARRRTRGSARWTSSSR